MKNILLAVTFVIATHCFAQIDTIQSSDLSYLSKNISGKGRIHLIFIDTGTNTKRCEGNYVNDKKDGIWLMYNRDGAVFRMETYKLGIKDGVWFVRSNGRFERKEQYRDDTLVVGHCFNQKGDEIPYFQEALHYADKMPRPKYDINKYLEKNLQYPESARKSRTEGMVVVQFIVNKDGSISNASVIRGIDSACNAEAIRLVLSMKPWKAGMQGDKNVPVYFTLPVRFYL